MFTVPDCVSVCVRRWFAANQIQDHTGTRVGAGGNRRPWSSVPRPESLPRKSPSSLLASHLEAPSSFSTFSSFIVSAVCSVRGGRSYGSGAPLGLLGVVTALGRRDGEGGGGGVHVRNDHAGPLWGRMYVCVCALCTVCVLLLITEVTEMWRWMERLEGVEKGVCVCLCVLNTSTFKYSVV